MTPKTKDETSVLPRRALRNVVKSDSFTCLKERAVDLVMMKLLRWADLAPPLPQVCSKTIRAR